LSSSGEIIIYFSATAERTLTPAGGEVEAVDGEAVDAAVFEELDDGFLGVGLGGEGKAGGEVAELGERREGRGRCEGGCRACRRNEARVLREDGRKSTVPEDHVVVELAKILVHGTAFN
jgi:hypothetical protein